MPLGSLRPSPLVEQATEQLRDQITQGEWPVGTRLPGEVALAKALGVGRSTIREALRALAGAGLVQARQGAGVFVIATEPAEDWAVRLRRAAITDVYEVRMIVETQAARIAAGRRTGEDVAALEAALAARAGAAERDDAAFVDADIALHAAVVVAAGNPVLSDLFAEFAPALRGRLIDLVELLGLRERDRNPGHDTHAALVAAIRDGDGAAAEKIVRAELEQTLTHLHAE